MQGWKAGGPVCLAWCSLVYLGSFPTTWKGGEVPRSLVWRWPLGSLCREWWVRIRHLVPFGWICEAGGSRSRKRFAPSPPLLRSLRAEGPRAPSWQLAAVDSQGVVGCRAMNGGMLRLLCPICRASHLRVFFRRLRSVREEDETPRGVRRRCNDPFSFFLRDCARDGRAGSPPTCFRLPGWPGTLEVRSKGRGGLTPGSDMEPGGRWASFPRRPGGGGVKGRGSSGRAPRAQRAPRRDKRPCSGQVDDLGQPTRPNVVLWLASWLSQVQY